MYREEIQIGGDFNPIATCMANVLLFAVSGAWGFILWAFVDNQSPVEYWTISMMALCVIIRAFSWHKNWLIRDSRIKALEINALRNMDSAFITEPNRVRRIQEATDRKSDVWSSYMLYLTPYGAIILFVSWLFGSYQV